jgi:NAD(P)-dependent dehydrogenase (short-subunit alcohol dehydrogenase family)
MRGDRFTGKSAIVSGGSTGCGASAARMLAAEGAKVGVIDRKAEIGRQLVKEIRDAGGTAVFAEADVSDAAAVKAAVKSVTDAQGPATLLFNHAGITIVKPFLELTQADIDSMIGINVHSMFFMSQAVLPGMLEAGGGAIVCTSSCSAICATPMEVLYDTTKGAVHQFARSLAIEFRDRNIRCNAVCPGFIRTPHGLGEIESLRKYGVKVTEADIAALQVRICEPEEVAAAALFLLSDEASFISATHLFVDNGYSAT